MWNSTFLAFVQTWDLTGIIYMLVSAITAPTTITLPDGRTAKGLVEYPACKSYYRGRGLWQVDAVVATGTFEV